MLGVIVMFYGLVLPVFLGMALWSDDRVIINYILVLYSIWFVLYGVLMTGKIKQEEESK